MLIECIHENISVQNVKSNTEKSIKESANFLLADYRSVYRRVSLISELLRVKPSARLCE